MNNFFEIEGRIFKRNTIYFVEKYIEELTISVFFTGCNCYDRCKISRFYFENTDELNTFYLKLLNELMCDDEYSRRSEK